MQAWQTDAMTTSQKMYITKIRKENPSLPPFQGKTKIEAAQYIERYKKGIKNNKETEWQLSITEKQRHISE